MGQPDLEYPAEHDEPEPIPVAAAPRFTINRELLPTPPKEGALNDVSALPAGVYPLGATLPGDRIELFQVNGRVYTVPRRVDPRIQFRMMRSLRKNRGGLSERAVADMMYDVLGESVIDALADEDLAAEELEQVMEAVKVYINSAQQSVSLGN